MSRQELLFVEFEPAETFSGFRALPVPVAFHRRDVDRVWTLYLHTDKTTRPDLPYRPVHRVNAFAEDYIHDWNIDNRGFRYASRVTDAPVWVLVEFKKEQP